jgi:hypothetical protein
MNLYIRCFSKTMPLLVPHNFQLAFPNEAIISTLKLSCCEFLLALNSILVALGLNRQKACPTDKVLHPILLPFGSHHQRYYKFQEPF